MPLRKNRAIAKLVANVNDQGQVEVAAVPTTLVGALGSLVSENYDSSGQLPTVGLSNGTIVSVNNSLYLASVNGWFRITATNNTPIIESILDSNGSPGPFYLATDGVTQTVITVTATDSEGFPITYSAITDSGFDTIATLSQSENVFTIDPYSSDSADAGAGTITFRASDGINIAGSVQSFSLNFITSIDINGTFTVNANTLNIGITADDLEFKADGKKMWALGDAGGIRQYTLSTAWDLSTATQDTLSSFSWGHPNVYPQGIAVSADGYTAVILDEGSGGLCYQYDMSTPYDMNTATYNTTIGERNFFLGFLGQTNSETGGAYWYDSGNILALYGRSRSIFATVDCSANPYTLVGATLIESTMMRDYDAGSYGSAAGIWSSDGTIIDMLGGTFVDTQAKRLVCSTPWRASTANTGNVISWTLPAGGGTGSENGYTHSPFHTMLFVSVGTTVKRIDIT